MKQQITLSLLVIGLVNFLVVPRLIAADSSAKLNGRFGNFTAYSLASKRIRHHRYELHLKQVARYSARLSSTIEGRVRFDPAIMKSKQAPFHDFDKPVRDDEMFEGEMRQLYLDYLGDSLRLTAGLQQIDWIDTLSPLGNDGMTPMDLRHGGFGDASEVIVPQGALRLNHSFVLGSLDWLLIPRPEHSRLPAGPNGYGIVEAAQENANAVNVTAYSAEEMQPEAREMEGGLRYLTSGDGWELTLMGYRGHQKTPVLNSRVSGMTLGPLGVQLPTYATESRYPLSPTYGIFSAFSGEAWVLRLNALYEPGRAPAHLVENPTPLAVDEDAERPHEVRSKVGFGFDYVFSKHLKIYTEQYGTRTQVHRNSSRYVVVGADPDKDFTDDYMLTARVTNETFEQLLLVMDAIFTSPYKAQVWVPHATWTFLENYELSLGARLVRSYNERSRYEPLKDASQIYVSLFRHFTAGN